MSVYVYISAKYDFGYIMRMVGYPILSKNSLNVMHINANAPMKYVLGFDLIDKKIDDRRNHKNLYISLNFK